MVERDPLGRYRAKRDFTRTPEPAPEPAGAGERTLGKRGAGEHEAGKRGTAERTGGKPGAGERPLSFVIQQHAARRLHYDVRLEVDGVLASWAVPKGPSYDPSLKRLAVHVEDHPLDYAGFEGLIPGGQYGAGRVIVWDRGSYTNLTEHAGTSVPVDQAIERGHLSVELDGSKLHGGWSFTRTSRPGSRQETWVMVKRRDETAASDYDVTVAEPRSVLSDRTLDELGEDEQTWTRQRATFVAPMLAELARQPAPDADGGGWVYERKLDGLRAIAVRNGDEVQLWSRNHLSFTQRFGEVVAALGELAAEDFTLDGELVAYDHDTTSFALLQQKGSRVQPRYEIFDVAQLLGADTRQLPLLDRQRLVAQLLAEDTSGVLHAVEHLDGTASELVASACKAGWEGLVAKRADSPYVSGRSRSWLKLKCDARQELVIGGFTEPRGSRKHLGAILVGYYDDEHRLRYAGKVGSGFDEATLTLVGSELAARHFDTEPFADLPREMRREAHFVRPELVANVVFSEWTADGRLRHPRFSGLRPDKPASEVVREQPGA